MKQTKISEKPISVTTVKDILEIVSKMSLGIVGFCYVSGLLILNIHLRKYGIYDFGFLKVEYILVGGLWGFIVTLVYCFTVSLLVLLRAVYNRLEEQERGRIKFYIKLPIRSFIVLVFYLLLTANALAYPLYILSEGELTLYSRLNLRATLTAIGVLIFTALIVVALISVAQHIVEQVKSTRSRNEIINEDSTNMFSGFESLRATALKLKIDHEQGSGAAVNLLNFLSGLSLVAMLLFCVGVYSLNILPRLSPAYGGAQRQKVLLISKADQIETFKKLGFQVSPDGRGVGPLNVVYESSDFFIFAPLDEVRISSGETAKAIRVNKDLIDAAFYVGDK